MRCKFVVSFLALATLVPSQAAVSMLTESPEAAATEAGSPAKQAIAAFEAGRQIEAVGMAKPLADAGDADALYLMGFAHESGQGAEASREKALEYYAKAAAGKNKDAVYRRSFMLLGSKELADRTAGREALEAAAVGDPAIAGRILGEVYLRGSEGFPANSAKALSWWTKAGDAGDVASILLVARLHEGQFGFPELLDQKKANDAYAKAAALGDAGAMAALGSRFLSGDEKLRDEKRGREWLKKAIDAGEPAAHLALGDYEEHVKKDLKAALANYERGKDAGQLDSMVRAASCYIDGKGTEKDTSRGWKILETAATSGSAQAHLALAARDLAADPPKLTAGYGHLVAASRGGLPEAQNELGLLYLSGRLGDADGPAGAAWLTRAAQAGFANAQNNLAILFEQGAGVDQNFNNAGQLYALAANQGHAGATLGLARLVARGAGTAPSATKAWALATLAVERGEKSAQELVDKLALGFDAGQKQAAAKELETIKADKPKDAPKPQTPNVSVPGPATAPAAPATTTPAPAAPAAPAPATPAPAAPAAPAVR
jgi:TPR repeat protein